MSLNTQSLQPLINFIYSVADQILINTSDESGYIQSKATIHLYGQENTPTIYAISKSDLLLKGEDPDKIVYGSTLSQYGFPRELRFDFMLTNPPYGTSWADDKKATAKLEQWLLNYFLLDGDDEESDASTSSAFDDSTEMAEVTLASLPKKKQKIAKQLCETASWKRDLDLMNLARMMADNLGDGIFNNFNQFEELFEKQLKELKLKLPAKDRKDLLGAISWTDPNAAPVIKKRNKDGSIEYLSDPALKDYENIPLKEGIQSFFEREVIPFAADAWWNDSETRIGYEINFNKYFYQYTPPRSKAEIAADLFAIERETENLLKEIVG
jgi:hypothetical protein